jgi:hypothetical protein
MNELQWHWLLVPVGGIIVKRDYPGEGGGSNETVSNIVPFVVWTVLCAFIKLNGSESDTHHKQMSVNEPNHAVFSSACTNSWEDFL